MNHELHSPRSTAIGTALLTGTFVTGKPTALPRTGLGAAEKLDG